MYSIGHKVRIKNKKDLRFGGVSIQGKILTISDIGDDLYQGYIDGLGGGWFVHMDDVEAIYERDDRLYQRDDSYDKKTNDPYENFKFSLEDSDIDDIVPPKQLDKSTVLVTDIEILIKINQNF